MVELRSGLASCFATHIEDARRVPNERLVVSALWMFELRDCDGLRLQMVAK